MILHPRGLCALFLLLLGSPALAQEVPAPPTAPETIFGKSKEANPVAAAPAIQFSIGNPTDDEQFLLELINRARKDADAEALRLLALTDPYVRGAVVNVNTNLMKAQFATNPPVGPLSFHVQLIDASRAHSQYLFDNALQSHFGPGPGQTLSDRLRAVNYSFKTAGENVFSYSQNSEHGHAAFEIDWNGTTADGGMQNPPGHRNSIHNGAFKEIGIGVVFGTNTVDGNTVGPMLITQDLATPPADVTYVTGVVFYDRNANNFYDLGEGCGGVHIAIDGLDTFAITTPSGGYSIPVTPNATYTVRFNAAGMSEVSGQVSVTASNRKLDLLMPILITSITSVPSITFAGISNRYTISPFAGATSYRARVQRLFPLASEDAENSLTNLTFNTTGSYSPISSTIKANGNRSFRLAHTNNLVFPGLQSMEFVRPFFVLPGAHVDFNSRLGISTSNQVARIEVSEDRQTWTTAWSQFGNQIPGGPDTSEKTFSLRSVPLTNFLGKLIYVRFTYSFAQLGSYFALTGGGQDNLRGWYIDDIIFTDALQPDDGAVIETGPEPVFPFTPPIAGEYIVRIQALNNTRVFNLGPPQYANAQANPPMITLTNNPLINGATIAFDFTVTGTATPYALDSAANPQGPWSVESNAVFTGPVAGHHSVSVASSSPQRYYRVRAN